jgi:DNA polymerase III epsilon subunit-like protein
VGDFDLPFLVNEFRRAGRTFVLRGRAVVDARAIFHSRERRDLAAAVRLYCHRAHRGGHRAAADARAAAAVVDAMLARYPDLPRTPVALHRIAGRADVAGWFRREGPELIFARGEHRGRRVVDIARIDPAYLDWLASRPLLEDA